MKTLLSWYLYDVTSEDSSLNGVMLRGRIRKLGIERGFNVLAENTEDRENGVRFAVLDVQHAQIIADYLSGLSQEIKTALVKSEVKNPVLSKLKVNDADRYVL